MPGTLPRSMRGKCKASSLSTTSSSGAILTLLALLVGKSRRYGAARCLLFTGRNSSSKCDPVGCCRMLSSRTGRPESNHTYTSESGCRASVDTSRRCDHGRHTLHGCRGCAGGRGCAGTCSSRRPIGLWHLDAARVELRPLQCVGRGLSNIRRSPVALAFLTGHTRSARRAPAASDSRRDDCSACRFPIDCAVVTSVACSLVHFRTLGARTQGIPLPAATAATISRVRRLCARHICRGRRQERCRPCQLAKLRDGSVGCPQSGLRCLCGHRFFGRLRRAAY